MSDAFADRSRLRWTRFAAPAIKFVISIALIWWLLHRIGLESVFEQFLSLSWFWLVMSLLTFIVSNIAGAFQWFLLLRAQGVPLSFFHAVSFYHVGLFFNNFLVGYVGGDAFRIYDVNRKTGQMAAAVSSVFFDRFIGFFALTSLAMFVSVFWIQDLVSRDSVFLTALILAGWIITILFLFNDRLAKKFSWLFRLLLPKMIHGKLLEIYYGIHSFKQNKSVLLSVFIIALLVQTLRIFTHVWAAYALGVRVDAFYFFIFVPMIALAASLPISIGGIGVREQSAVALFAQISLASAKITAFEFLAYLVGIAASLPGGLFFIFRHERIDIKRIAAFEKPARKS